MRLSGLASRLAVDFRLLMLRYPLALFMAVRSSWFGFAWSNMYNTYIKHCFRNYGLEGNGVYIFKILCKEIYSIYLPR